MKKLLALLLALALCLSFAACAKTPVNQGTAAGDGGSDAGDGGSEPTEFSADKADGREVVNLGLVYTGNGYFWDGVTVGAEAKQREINTSQGEYFVDILCQGPAEMGAANQLALFENMVSQGFQGLGITCADAMMLRDSIDRAVDGGCEILCFDTDSPDSKRFAFVGSDNYEFGYVLGTYLMDAISERGGGGILFEGSNPAMLGMYQRQEGFMQALEEHPDCFIANMNSPASNTGDTTTQAENAITAHPDFMGSCIINAGGEMLVNIWRARNWTEEDKILVLSDDLNAVIQGVKDDVVLGTCVQGQYNWGYTGIELLFNAVTKGEYPEDVFVNTGCWIVDSSNVFEQYPQDTTGSNVG